MTKGIAPVTQGRVKYGEVARVAFDGEVQNADRILVACGGFAREIWPTNVVVGDPEIVMTTSAVETRDSVQAPGTAEAFFRFANATGKVEWGWYGVTQSEQALQPPVGSSGQFICRMTTVSGTISGPSGWVDVTTLPEWTVSETVEGQTEEAEGTFEIAEDDGGGSPVGGTEVAKTVDFTAEVTGSTTNPGFEFSSSPWDLENITSDTEAQVAFRITLEVGPDTGRVEGWEGLPNDNSNRKYNELYGNPADRSELVRITAVSGDTAELVGTTAASLLGVWLQLDWVNGYQYSYEVRAPDDGDDFTVEATMEVDDGDGLIVTKNITLHAQRGDEPPTSSEIDLPAGPFAGVAIATDAPLSQLRFTARNDGTMTFEDHNGTSQFGWPKDWNDSAPTPPDPENFLVRVVLLSGSAPNGAGEGNLNQWYSLQFNRTWSLNVTSAVSEPVLRQGEWEIQIKKNGAADSSASSMELNLSVTNESSADDGGGPPPIEP